MSNEIPKVSVIVPVINEFENLQKVVDFFQEAGQVELIVVDGGSTDKTGSIASKFHHYIQTEKGRAIQMNAGAKVAQGDVLFFLHADCIPPKSWHMFAERVMENPKQFGSFRFAYNSKQAILSWNSYLTRFPLLCFRGGDQGLLVARETFLKVGGFDEAFVIMEDYEIIRRLRKKLQFLVFPESMTISDRKFSKNPFWKVVIAYWLTYWGFCLRIKPTLLHQFYCCIIR
ncbi:MAG: rSAM/selenodomain-associated transferase 2 [Sphingobacteriales bacterium]|jgi:rSAM/selenodomain-associated transferase 2